jgi:DNA mismatch repair protein MutS
MMGQYFEIKRKYEDCLLFFRLGDFYEMFYDDARIASKALDIALTARKCGNDERAPMCGVPFHSAESYIARLLEQGFKIAICEQMEDPKLTKNLVKREVVRVITPGTVIDSNMLDAGTNNYIMAVYHDRQKIGLACADVTTGEFLTAEFPLGDENKLPDALSRFNPSEIIINAEFTGKEFMSGTTAVKASLYAPWYFEHKTAHRKLCGHFKTFNLEGFGLEGNTAAVCAAGALLEYLTDTQKNSLAHISSIKNYTNEKFMTLDASSRRNLELTETLRGKNKRGSLLWTIDLTRTAMGARLIRKWIHEPLLDAGDIMKRLDAAEEWKDAEPAREELRELLGTVYDIERLMGKVIYGAANGRDMSALKRSFANLSDIKKLLGNLKAELNVEMHSALDPLEDLYALIDSALRDDPPVTLKDGGLIKDGYSAELDRLRSVKANGEQWMLEMETKEREATGIKNLKIRYSKVFGYCIEVTNSYLNIVPDRYIRRQTLSNCERFATMELKAMEDEILGAEEKQVALEYKLFTDMRDKVAAAIERVQLTAMTVAALDALQSFAEAADRNNYVKPVITAGGVIDIRGGRHPVVEKTIGAGTSDGEAFIPNDTLMDTRERRLAIITGPNMAGKSTFMRQTALIVLMAQAGSFVPADYAEIGIVDRIFTRVGASDDLATGQSTFMVEMSEVANILNNATLNSLVILDEIGRGTSTYDGLSIAWAVLEYLASEIGAKTLFATHYHELTELEGRVEGVVNYSVTVMEQSEDIIFLRKIARGGAGSSYGIHVAKLAGLPGKVLDRSNEILDALGQSGAAKDVPSGETRRGRRETYKSEGQRAVIEELLNINIDALAPREALSKLYELQVEVKRRR